MFKLTTLAIQQPATVVLKEPCVGIALAATGRITELVRATALPKRAVTSVEDDLVAINGVSDGMIFSIVSSKAGSPTSG